MESNLNIPETLNNMPCVYLFHAVTTLQLKEELIDGEDYSFLQGASDQESNGSASFYIKQEPWEGSRTEGGRGGILHRTDFYSLELYSGAILLGHFAKHRKFQFQIFQVGGETILVVGGNFSIYKRWTIFVLYLKLLKEFCNIFQVWIYVHC